MEPYTLKINSKCSINFVSFLFCGIMFSFSWCFSCCYCFFKLVSLSYLGFDLKMCTQILTFQFQFWFKTNIKEQKRKMFWKALRTNFLIDSEIISFWWNYWLNLFCEWLNSTGPLGVFTVVYINVEFFLNIDFFDF